jgi:DNA-binding phage protein
MPTSRSYHSSLLESLRDPSEAAAYLDAVIEECNYEELLLALENVLKAQQQGLNDIRDNQHLPLVLKSLSSNATPDLISLLQALGELGFRLSVTPMEGVA